MPMWPHHRTLFATATACALIAAAPGAVLGQPANLRTPNLEGTWITPGGTLFFSFLHRFQVTSGKVINFPMFHLSAGFYDWLSLGTLYSSQSLVPGVGTNEFELFAGQRWLDQEQGAPISLSLKEAYNVSLGSPDLDLNLSRQFGPLTAFTTLRGMARYGGGTDPRISAGAGLGWALTPFLTLAADGAYPIYAPGLPSTEPPIAWGAGAQIAIPYTPHTLSLQVSNTASASIQGASTATSDLRYGFEFTIPFANGRQWLDIVMPATVQATPEPVAASPMPIVSGSPVPVSGTPVPAASPPPPVGGTVTPEAKAFFVSRCTPCHGQGGVGGFGPNLRPVEAKGDAFILGRIKKGSPKGMPAFEHLLSAKELDNLVTYVKSLK